MVKIKNVVFDIGRVLIDYRWEDYLSELHFPYDIEKRLGKVIFQSKIWSERDRGLYTEEEYIQQFIQSAPELEKEILRVLSTINQAMKPFSFATEWIRSIKMQGLKVYLLSNYPKNMFEDALQNYEFFQYVDGMVISYEAHQIKPEPEIYNTLIERYHLIPEETIFLDDVKKNTNQAEGLGFHTICVTSHQAAVDGLKKYGIISE
ncbi:MAG: HAD family phosphatase [Lachnospiraceae bacterium]|nr:HAD family phosphatase [Lachnospiraceae bacterium]